MPERNSLDPAIAIVQFQRKREEPVETWRYDDPRVNAWANYTATVVDRVFGENSLNSSTYRVNPQVEFNDSDQQRTHIRWTEQKKVLLDSFIEQLKTLPSTGLGAITLEREGFYFAGQNFDAMLRIAKLLQAAKTSIVIIDNYFGQDVLALLASKRLGVSVQVLMKPQFVASPKQAHLLPLFRNFNQQHQGLSIRTADIFHDRFLILDAEDFFHFGASFEHLGTRGFMFSRIEEPEVVEAFRQRFDQAWAAATPVP